MDSEGTGTDRIRPSKFRDLFTSVQGHIHISMSSPALVLQNHYLFEIPSLPYSRLGFVKLGHLYIQGWINHGPLGYSLV